MNYDSLIKELNLRSDKAILRTYNKEKTPDRKTVIEIIKILQTVLFDGYFSCEFGTDKKELLTLAKEKLEKEINSAFSFSGNSDINNTETTVDEFFAELPAVKDMLQKDIIAIYNGDPAAKCNEEVLICYPGFYAISIYRIAHILYKLNVPLVPRIMTEYAHEKTGIDIHAGATIGEYFFIDHGTGIVIGETTTIGNNVKLYQGVTLGAKSFELDENGNPVKNIKRHPDIGNNVIIYANATILGGNTKVGDNCTIGASVWITSSVESGKTVYRN